MFDQISILGPGLLGTSLALAIRKRWPSSRIHLYARRPEVAKVCASRPWCDEAFQDPVAAVAGSGLVVACTPVNHIVDLGKQLQEEADFQGILTDVGSTKGLICRSISTTGAKGSEFLGSHPMAGGEKSGMEAAEADLFEGRVCLICPTPKNSRTVIEKLTRFWSELGMITRKMSPEEHDRGIAKVSHLPHYISSCLAAFLNGDQHRDQLVSISGPGLKDTTRIAAGDPALWVEIAMQNRDAILQSLESFQVELDHLRVFLREDNPSALGELLERGAAFRRQLDETPG